MHGLASPTLERPKHWDHEFRVSLGYTLRPQDSVSQKVNKKLYCPSKGMVESNHGYHAVNFQIACTSLTWITKH